MSKQLYAGCGGLGDFIAINVPELHELLLARYEATTDFPLHRAKPEIDNSPDCNEGPRIYPRPARGSKRAYLRRRARGSL